MKTRSKIVVQITLIALMLYGYSGCKKQTPKPEVSPANSNTTPAMSPTLSPSPSPQNQTANSGWTLDDGKRAALSDYLGKVVLLDFYATWCEPCRDETPGLVRMQSQYEAQGFQIIGLNVGGDDDRQEVPGFAREFKIQYPLGFPDDEFVDSYLKDNQNIPQTFVFDRDGKLIKRFIGYDKQEGREIERLIQQTLGSTTQ
jgi:thiol-disulfide isomerase/thioredoxin